MNLDQPKRSASILQVIQNRKSHTSHLPRQHYFYRFRSTVLHLVGLHQGVAMGTMDAASLAYRDNAHFVHLHKTGWGALSSGGSIQKPGILPW